MIPFGRKSRKLRACDSCQECSPGRGSAMIRGRRNSLTGARANRLKRQYRVMEWALRVILRARPSDPFPCSRIRENSDDFRGDAPNSHESGYKFEFPQFRLLSIHVAQSSDISCASSETIIRSGPAEEIIEITGTIKG